MAQTGVGTQTSATGGDETAAAGDRGWLGSVRAAGPGGSVGEPLLVLFIGIALVLVDQNSSEVSSLLRTPALLGGLVLAAHGLNQVTHRWANPDPVPVSAEEVARERREDDDEAVRPPGPGPIPWILIVLAVWLGLAALALPTAPLSLILLSLLAAILLFSDGLKRMNPEEG